MMTMIKVTTITTRVTTMITTTTRTLAELDSKMQYFAAMHDCSCLLKNKQLRIHRVYSSPFLRLIIRFFVFFKILETLFKILDTYFKFWTHFSILWTYFSRILTHSSFKTHFSSWNPKIYSARINPGIHYITFQHLANCESILTNLLQSRPEFWLKIYIGEKSVEKQLVLQTAGCMFVNKNIKFILKLVYSGKYYAGAVS